MSLFQSILVMLAVGSVVTVIVLAYDGCISISLPAFPHTRRWKPETENNASKHTSLHATSAVSAQNHPLSSESDPHGFSACKHDWRATGSGQCIYDYCSYGGCDSIGTYVVYSCRKCDATYRDCTCENSGCNDC